MWRRNWRLDEEPGREWAVAEEKRDIDHIAVSVDESVATGKQPGVAEDFQSEEVSVVFAGVSNGRRMQASRIAGVQPVGLGGNDRNGNGILNRREKLRTILLRHI